MNRIAVLMLVLCLGSAAFAGAPAKKSTAKKTAPKAAVSGQATPKKSATAKKSTRKRSTSARARARRPRQGWRYGQMQPAPERYREIQQALVDKGYASDTPDGRWGSGWDASLKRFQQDQNLQPNGKLNSLSLMALGLGPRRDTTAIETAAPAKGDEPALADPPNRGPQ